MRRTLWTLSILFLLSACGDSPAEPDAAPVPTVDTRAELMERYCTICHALPQPTDLDRTTWRDFILVRMAAYMGIFYAYEGSYDNLVYYDSLPGKWLEPGVGGERVLENQIYPEKPLLAREEFEQIRDYILEKAPERSNGPVGTFAVPKDLAGFRVKLLPLDTSLQALVSVVKIVPEEKAIYAGLLMQSLMKMDADGKVLNEVEGLTMPVQIKTAPGRFEVVDLGSMGGSDNPQGKYLEASSWANFRRGQYTAERENLMRPVQHHRADLDGDGQEDQLLLEFGYHMGQMTWMPGAGDSDAPQVLFADDGSVAAALHDWNGDGRMDIAALHANSDERLMLYENEGAGKFKEHLVERYPPHWGGAAMEMADVNQDGKMDLVVAHGDNGDYPPILKAGHGIRIYTHQGDFKFEETQKLPMNGAYGIRVRDFDLDGDMDIAAVSFYPDYRGRPEEQFIYYEQTSPMEFTPHTFPQVNVARWMVLDAGDVDGDGDEDIVLGGFNVKSDDASDAQYQYWTDRNIGLVLLENKAR